MLSDVSWTASKADGCAASSPASSCAGWSVGVRARFSVFRWPSRPFAFCRSLVTLEAASREPASEVEVKVKCEADLATLKVARVRVRF